LNSLFLDSPSNGHCFSKLLGYIRAAGLADQKKTPFFRSVAGRLGKLTKRPIYRVDAFRMINHRVKLVALAVKLCNHNFRATGITTF
jgi:hypothetical protein